MSKKPIKREPAKRVTPMHPHHPTAQILMALGWFIGNLTALVLSVSWTLHRAGLL